MYRWFKPWGWTYRPASVPAVVLVALVAYFCATVIRAANRHAHSGSDFLYAIFPYVVPSLMVLHWIASNTSDSKRPPLR